MMPSYIRSVIRSAGLLLASVASLIVLALFNATPAQALSVSVGTPTVLSGVSVDNWAWAGASERVHVVYSTSNATTYTIMYASNTPGGNYSFTVLSTGAVANRPLYLSLALTDAHVPHVYYYDASTRSICYLIGNQYNALPQYLLGTNRLVTTGMSLAAPGGPAFLLTYSSQTANASFAGKYDLIAASVTFGTSSDSLNSLVNVVVSSAVGNAVNGVFGSYKNTTTGEWGITYFDSDDSSLRNVLIYAGNLVGSKDIIDTGSIRKLYVTETSDVTRLVYSHATDGVKYAVMRRKISPQCWYIQKLDDGDAQVVVGPNVSYVKNNTLYLAKGLDGIYFDAFDDNITNNQAGKAPIAGNVTAGGVVISGFSEGTKVRGVYQPNSTGGSGLASINWTALTGNVQTSRGTNLPSIKLKAVMGLGSASAATTFDPNTSANTAGAITDTSGNYTLLAASGIPTATITPSSFTSAGAAVWSYFNTVDGRSLSTATLTVDSRASGVSSLNFIAVSSPVLYNVIARGDNGAVEGATIAASYGLNFDVLTTTFTVNTRTDLLSDVFPLGGSFRFVANSLSFTADKTTGTLAQFNAAGASQHVAGTGHSYNSASQAVSLAAGFRGIFASSETSNLPRNYDLVFTTGVLQGQTTDYLQSFLRNAIRVTPMKFDTVYFGTAATNSSVITTTGSDLWITVVATNGPTFPRGAAGVDPRGSVGSVFLSTTTDLSLAPSQIGGKVTVTVVASTGANIINGTANIQGLKTPASGFSSQNWYMRVSTQVAGMWHSAISPVPVTFSTPSITSVLFTNNAAGLDSNGAEAYIATGSVTGLQGVVAQINGNGFLPTGSTVYITTHTTFVEGLPATGLVGDQSANVTAFVVKSATWATVTFQPNPASLNKSLNIVISTAGLHGLTGFAGFDVAEATVNARALSTSVTVSSRSISHVRLASAEGVSLEDSANPVIANTRNYSLSIFGWGLASSSVTFVAVDGSSRTATFAATAVSDRKLSVSNVDFHGLQAGKFYTIVVTTAPNDGIGGQNVFSTGTIATGRFDTASAAFSPNVVWVASMTISTITTPIITNIPNGTIYNSTSNVVLAVRGAGLVDGSSVTFANGSFNFSTVTLTANPVADDGRTMFVLAPGTNSATAGVPSSGFLNASAGSYAVVIATLTPDSAISVDGTGRLGQNLTRTANGSLTILDATLSSIVNNNETNYAPMPVASYTITGTGLMDGATAVLLLSNNASLPISTGTVVVQSVARTSATVSFDLRTATGSTNSNWIMNVDMIGRDTLGVYATSVKRLTQTGLTINRNPVITAVSPNKNSNTTGGTLQIQGRGLTNGATVSFSFIDTANTHIQTATGLSSTTFEASGNLTSADPSGWFGSVTFPSLRMPGQWKIIVTTAIANTASGQSYGAVNNTLPTPTPYFSSQSTFTYTVTESSAPNAPTGLTVLASGVKTVTLRWVSPGNDGTTDALLTGSKFIVYYSSGDATRGDGCGVCFPNRATALAGETLTNSNTNYSFANTWANFLPFGYANSNRVATTTILAVDATTSSAKGLTVSTVTLSFSDLTVKTSSNATGAALGASLAPGLLLEYKLTLDPGNNDGNFWFVVRAVDESGNYSGTDVIYSTAVARILANQVVSTVLDPTKDNVIQSKALSGGVTAGGLVPAGALDSADTLSVGEVTNPPAATAGTDIVGGVADYTLASGQTEFKKAITLSFALSGNALSRARAVSTSLVKVAFFNGSRWVIIADSGLDGDSVSCRVTHLTQFAVVIVTPVTNLSQATAYPNPYRPSLATHAAQKITFDLLPANTSIKIYTLAGDLVRELSDTDGNGVEVWDAKNNNGQDVASGVYFALMNGAGDKRTLKVAVQR